jgi:single-stranded DNA-specific DHH superfamily exonuclease
MKFEDEILIFYQKNKIKGIKEIQQACRVAINTLLSVYFYQNRNLKKDLFLFVLISQISKCR